MTIWFVTIGLLGLEASLVTRACWSRRPPLRVQLSVWARLHRLLVLGAVFLCATGAEALYADMGHFGPRPIRFAWYGLVLPLV